MIRLYYGDNDFALKKELKEATDNFDNDFAVEKIEAETITPDDLPNILTGMSLFSTNRLIILYDPSSNKAIWDKLADFVEKGIDAELIIVDPSPDKRTRTFKLLQKQSQAHEFKKLGDVEAKKWLVDYAKNMNIAISMQLADRIIERVGVDQWKLHFGLQKLSLSQVINEQSINEHLEISPQANVFALIDASLHRSPKKVHELVQVAMINEDPYFFFGLLSSQIFQLVALASTDKKPQEVAIDLGVHPYPLQKLQSLAKQLDREKTRDIAVILADCDDKLKRSGAEPWMLIEQALVKLANR